MSETEEEHQFKRPSSVNRQNSITKYSNRIQPRDQMNQIPIEMHEIDNGNYNNQMNFRSSIGSSKQVEQFNQQMKRQKEKQNEIEEQEENDSDIDDDDETDEIDSSSKGNFITKAKNAIVELLKKPITKNVLVIVAVILYLAYFCASIVLNKPFSLQPSENATDFLDDRVFSNNKGLALFVLSLITFMLIAWDNLVAKYYLILYENKIQPLFSESTFIRKYGSWILVGLIFLACALYLGLTVTDPYNLVSLSGLFAFVIVIILVSEKSSHINWHILIVGLEIQFILGVFLMRTEFGYKFFKFVGKQVTTFLDYTNVGSKFVFGNSYEDHRFVFQAIPVIVFFSAIINLLYFLGAIQYVILKVAWIVNFLMGTTPTESMNATANIFLGQTEAPLLIKPFLTKMTQSELFSVMTGGFATVAGSVLAAYISFNVPANHLIIASLLAAPGALAVSKTMFPETRKTKASWDAIKNLPKGQAISVAMAISEGASNVVGPIGGIISNLIAFVAFFAFVDAIFIWCFSMLGLESFGLTSIMEYLFWPFALLMGVSIEDCRSVSKLIGTKIFVNEFVAYEKLGTMIKFREGIIANGTYDLYYNGTLSLPAGGVIWSDRSILIATYALCGFANFASVGIQIGGLSLLAPKRAKVFAKFAVKAMLAGNITNFITACIAGLLFQKI